MTSAIWSAPVLGTALLMVFFTITFLQSAVDKVWDWRGNLEFLTGHFKGSPLGSMVPLLLGTITVAEILSGILCFYALFSLLQGDGQPALCALTASGLTLLMLLFGQRLAKDYAGAATISGYFGLVILGFLLAG